MEYVITYITDKHPEERVFTYYGGGLIKAIEVLERYLNARDEILIKFSVKKQKAKYIEDF
jgi:hypothetical protein